VFRTLEHCPYKDINVVSWDFDSSLKRVVIKKKTIILPPCSLWLLVLPCDLSFSHILLP
jgi:hypothetical protein